jgi:hypothetical protein
MALTVQLLVNQACLDIAIIYPGQTPSVDESNIGFWMLNEILGSWSQEGLLVPTHTLTSFALVAGTAAYTMGVGGTWNTAALPVKIKGAVASLSGFQKGLKILSMTDFQKLIADGLGETAALPMLLGVDDAAPQRNVRLHQIPNNSEATVEVSYWTPLTQFTLLTEDITFPMPGFYQALRDELTLRMAVTFKRPVDPNMMMNAKNSKSALARIDPGEITDAAQMTPMPTPPPAAG